MGDQPAGRNVGRRGRAWLALRGQRLLFMGWRGVQSEPQSGACCSKKHHHVPFWLYATPAHAIRDVLHASNYLTITEGPGRFGSILGQHVTTHVDVHTSLLLACNRPSCNTRQQKPRFFPRVPGRRESCYHVVVWCLRCSLCQADTTLAALSTIRVWIRSSAALSQLVMSVSVFLLGIIAQSPRYPITDQLDREVAPHPRATLAIGVMSAPGDSSRRGYIRPSLHRACASDTGLIFRFVLGLRGVSSTMVASTVAENATFGDLLGLSAARDGGRQFFAEKTLAWLRYAGRAFPLADFIGKVDQDTYFVWNRARRLLDLAVWQAGNRPLYIGQIEWTSFLPEERRVCGCCGYTREHAAYLQSQAGARFGSCGPQKSASTSISGPFPFAQGASYALSRAALETGILRSSEADETQAVLASDRWRSGSEEDIMVGFLLSRSVPDLLILHWGLTIFHDFDRAGLFQNYYQIERACLDQHAIKIHSAKPTDHKRKVTLGHGRDDRANVRRGASCCRRAAVGACRPARCSVEPDAAAPWPPRMLLPEWHSDTGPTRGQGGCGGRRAWRAWR